MALSVALHWRATLPSQIWVIYAQDARSVIYRIIHAEGSARSSARTRVYFRNTDTYCNALS